MKLAPYLILLTAACKPHASRHHTIDPVYDCVTLTDAQREDFSKLIDECDEAWECEQRAMQLYCQEMSPHEGKVE